MENRRHVAAQQLSEAITNLNNGHVYLPQFMRKRTTRASGQNCTMMPNGFDESGTAIRQRTRYRRTESKFGAGECWNLRMPESQRRGHPYAESMTSVALHILNWTSLQSQSPRSSWRVLNG